MDDENQGTNGFMFNFSTSFIVAVLNHEQSGGSDDMNPPQPATAVTVAHRHPDLSHTLPTTLPLPLGRVF